MAGGTGHADHGVTAGSYAGKADRQPVWLARQIAVATELGHERAAQKAHAAADLFGQAANLIYHLEDRVNLWRLIDRCDCARRQIGRLLQNSIGQLPEAVMYWRKSKVCAPEECRSLTLDSFDGGRPR